MLLTAWNAGHTALQTGAHAAGAANNTAVLSDLADQTDGYVAVKVSAWLEDTTTNEQKALDGDGHAAAWAAAVNALNSGFTATYTFAYNDSYSVANKTALASGEVKFYYAAKASGNADAISYASETTNPVQSVQVSAKDLVTSNTTSGTAKQLGYLYIRADGSQNAHTNGTAYVAPIKVTSAVA